MGIIKIAKIWSVSVFCSILLIWLYHEFFQSKPPFEEMAGARSILSQARENRASNYKEKEYRKAVSYYDSAMIFWGIENDKFILFRNYSVSKYYADQANYWASVSTNNIKEMQNSRIDKLNMLLSSVRVKIESFKHNYGRLPLDKKQAHQLAKARMLYREANVSYANQNWNKAEENLALSENLINKLNKVFYDELAYYFRDFNHWDLISSSAISNSKENKNELLVIDKYARKCHVYKAGHIVHSFDIELGTNWMGDKQHAGDKTTPEGSYKVIKKKGENESNYHKALLLDYPNEEDKARFIENRSNGAIPANLSIGNSIEIHGDGGKGRDWTDGCIALKNSDMDTLFAICNEGTAIIIVGSLISLEEILQ